MDQNAFRNLVASGSSSTNGAPKSKSRGVLGGTAPKRGAPGKAGVGIWGIKVKPGNEYVPPAEDAKPSTSFMPRNQQRKKDDGRDKADREKEESRYRDRAEMRRKGLDDEYKPVEELLETLEKRQKEEGVGKEEIDRQRAYLGGDAQHSILVKGLDYALLARTKAELAAKGEEVADEELEELVRESKGKKEVKEPPKPAEKLGKGFKSIAAKAEPTGPTGEKKKKKKKKVIRDGPPTDASVPETSVAGPSRPKPDLAAVEAVKKATSPPPPAPPPVDDDDDIFGDAGDYDLTAGRLDEDSSDEEGEDLDDANARPRSGSRSRSTTPDRHGQRYRRAPSRSRDRSDRRDRSLTPDEGHYSGRSRSFERHYSRRDRSISRDRYDRRRDRSYSRDRYRPTGDRSPEYRRYSHRDRSSSRDRREHHRDGTDRGDRYDSRDRTYSRDRYSPPRARRDRSPSPRARRQPSRTPPPPSKRPRQATRSPSPILFNYEPRAGSPTPSAESDDDHLVGGKLQPLKSSAISDVKGYLSLDAEAAKDEEKRARKAKWRARQGLGLQEGQEKYLEREVGDKEKANRDYVKLMNKIKKGEGDEEKK